MSNRDALSGARDLARRERPLEGLRVLELGSLIAGPFATRIMAEFGAEVIKVERPELGEDPRYKTNADRTEHAEELDALIEEWVQLHPTGEILRILDEAAGQGEEVPRFAFGGDAAAEASHGVRGQRRGHKEAPRFEVEGWVDDGSNPVRSFADPFAPILANPSTRFAHAYGREGA
jgi:hypothetical protein